MHRRDQLQRISYHAPLSEVPRTADSADAKRTDLSARRRSALLQVDFTEFSSSGSGQSHLQQAAQSLQQDSLTQTTEIGTGVLTVSANPAEYGNLPSIHDIELGALRNI